jgi:hypothetical protein
VEHLPCTWLTWSTATGKVGVYDPLNSGDIQAGDREPVLPRQVRLVSVTTLKPL